MESRLGRGFFLLRPETPLERPIVPGERSELGASDTLYMYVVSACPKTKHFKYNNLNLLVIFHQSFAFITTR